MNIDFIRGVLSHGTAALVVLVGLGALVWMTANGTIPDEVGVPAIVGIVTGAAGFMFGSETSKQASKQAERNILQNPQDPPPAP